MGTGACPAGATWTRTVSTATDSLNNKWKCVRTSGWPFRMTTTVTGDYSERPYYSPVTTNTEVSCIVTRTEQRTLKYEQIYCELLPIWTVIRACQSDVQELWYSLRFSNFHHAPRALLCHCSSTPWLQYTVTLTAKSHMWRRKNAHRWLWLTKPNTCNM
jgi:hypothetical protein